MNSLDIIIPVYNSDKQLLSTLFSIGYFPEYNIKNIIIIDDCSNCNNDYQKSIDIFSSFYNIIYYKFEENKGPGMARQKGLEFSTANYILFIDCGDLIHNIFTFKNVFSLILENPDIYVFSYAHSMENCNNLDYISPKHNRLLGKIFRKDFLIKYNISFNSEEPRTNEDIGFNIACRLICQDLFKKTNILRYAEIDEPLIIWVYDSNSITRKDNHAFYYWQGKGLGVNGIYAINLAEKNNVDQTIIQEEAYSIFCNLYFIYIGALNIRPEYADESLLGAIYFYENYLYKNINNLNPKLFLTIYNNELKNLINNLDEPFFAKFPPFSIIDFLNKLEKLKNYKGE